MGVVWIVCMRKGREGQYYRMDGIISWAKICKATIGAVMVGVGCEYMDECNNGVTTFLIIGGAFLLLANLPTIYFPVLLEMCELLPCTSDKKNGQISTTTCYAVFFTFFCIFILGVIFIQVADIVCIIWGTVPLFQTYSKWSHDETKDESPYYCSHTPVMVFIVTLVINWIQYPLLTVWMFFNWRSSKYSMRHTAINRKI